MGTDGAIIFDDVSFFLQKIQTDLKTDRKNVKHITHFWIVPDHPRSQKLAYLALCESKILSDTDKLIPTLKFTLCIKELNQCLGRSNFLSRF